MEWLYCGIIGYLMGAVNPSYLLAKRRGVDIRTRGSGNAGATNAMLLFGKSVGVFCALFDIAKAYLAVFLAELLFPEFSYAVPVTSVFCIVGHVFPFYMKFKGGKGFACLSGIVLCYDRGIFLLMLLGALVLALVSDYICFVPVLASLVFPILYGFLEQDLLGAIILSVIAVIMVAKHLENFRRIYGGTELRLSYLWKPKAEEERLRNNLGDPNATAENYMSGRKI